MIARLSVVVGIVFIAAALVLIWGTRSTIDQVIYVSGLGADGMPTASAFMVALLCIVVGGTLIAWPARHIRATVAILRWGSPAVSICVATAFFLFASQVPCSYGCPLPLQPTFVSVQDLLHIVAAVIAFGMASWAMLQSAFSGRRGLAPLSLISAIAVAVIAAAGGLMSVAGFRRDIGAWLEFVATTIGLTWIAALGVYLVMEAAPRGPRRERAAAGVSDREAAEPAQRA